MTTWNLDRLRQLISDNVEESVSLEYKAAEALGKSDAKKAEIVKDVSAFANSSGGVLIYGIAEFQQRDQRHRPEKIDAVDRQQFSKEWLEQIIQSIQPRIQGIVIEPIAIESSVCYVLTIPQSHTAHQARDHVYYRRHNFNVLAMEDYEVRDVMNRRKRPKIRASIFASRSNTTAKGVILVKLDNIGVALAKDYMVDLQLPIDLGGHISVEKPAFLEDRDGKYFWSFRLGPNALHMPIFPDSNVMLRRKFATGVTVRSLDGAIKRPSTDAAVVAVYVDEMPPIKATIAVHDIVGDWTEIGAHR